MLIASNLELIFDKRIVGPFSFEAKPGEIVALYGERGAGKTSLLLSLMGSFPPSHIDAYLRGNVSLFNIPIIANTVPEGVVFVSDNPYAQLTGLNRDLWNELLFPAETKAIPENVAVGMGFLFACLLEIHHKINYPVVWLSGGELARLHLASSLVGCPKLILWDEPFEELDIKGRIKAIDMLSFYCRYWSAIGIVSFCDNDLLANNFDKIVTLRGNGRAIAASGLVTPNVTTPKDRQKETKKVLDVRDLSFQRLDSELEFFGGLSFSVSVSELVFFLGSNGTGKSTFCRILTKELIPSQGVVRLSDQLLDNISNADLNLFLSIAFQDSNSCLFCSDVATELNTATLTYIAKDSLPYLLEALELTHSLASHPYDLERSVRRRLSVLISLLRLSPLIVLDEPTLQQDDFMVKQIAQAIRWALEQGSGILCITHDKRLLEYFLESKQIALKLPLMLESDKSKKHSKQYRPSPRRPGGSSPLLASNARQWAVEEWSGRIGDWISHTTVVDKHWEKIVIPALRKMLRDTQLPTKLLHLDLGCGLGFNTEKVHDLLEKLSCSEVQTLGLDIQPKLVNQAKCLMHNRAISFSCLDATMYDSVSNLVSSVFSGNKPNIITCFYVLHDEANMKAILRSVRNAIDRNGILILSIVHPEDAELLLTEGFLSLVDGPKITADISDNQYARWAGYYPIRDDGKTVLELPYFHRTIEDYISALNSEGFKCIGTSVLNESHSKVDRKSGLLLLARNRSM